MLTKAVVFGLWNTTGCQLSGDSW